MRTTFRFVAVIAVGLFSYIFWLTGVVLLIMEVILPPFALTNSQMTVAGWISIILSAVSGAILFSYLFVKPIAAMMRLVSDISAGNHNPQGTQKLYRKSGGLKLKYWLYKELISDLDSLAEQLKQAELEREKLEQLKRDWVRGISHDVKTPLSYVVGYSALLLSQDHSWTREEQQNFLSQIHQKGKYIESLVNNMNLSFRLEDSASPLPLQISEFDLIVFMEKLVADMLNQQPSADYSISLQAMDEHLNIEADEQLLYRAVSNLINNAISHNPSGTEIMVEVRRDKQKGVNIIVRDHGVGMPRETADNLFKKYGDTNGKKDYVGGLGLFIVKSIIDAHHGEISVESIENEGTAFTVHLPLRNTAI